MIDIKAIKQAAEAATQGNWWVTAQGKHVVAANEGRVCVAPEHMARWNWDANATHIAKANPSTVIALCDEIERLTIIASELQDLCDRQSKRLAQADKQMVA